MMELRALLALSVLLAASHASRLADFKEWSSVYLPEATQEELDNAYRVWKENAEFVFKHNKHHHRFTLTLNKFAHLVRRSHWVPSVLHMKPVCVCVFADS